MVEVLRFFVKSSETSSHLFEEIISQSTQLFKECIFKGFIRLQVG